MTDNRFPEQALLAADMKAYKGQPKKNGVTSKQ